MDFMGLITEKKTFSSRLLKKKGGRHIWKLNLSTEEYKAGPPLHNKSFIDFNPGL